MIANKAWGLDCYRDVVGCDAMVCKPRGGRITLALTQANSRRFDIEGERSDWQNVHWRLGEELAKYVDPCRRCSCVPCQCEHEKIVFRSAQQHYITRLADAVEAEARDTGDTSTDAGKDAATNAILSREAADTAFGVFARLAAAEGLMAMLNGSLRPL